MYAHETHKHYERGFVCGAFDMFHIGHLNLIRRAKERCDYLIAGVLEDAAVGRKGKWPVIPEAERLAIVAAIRDVDEAALIRRERATKLEILADHPYNAFFSGDDWSGDDSWRHEELALAGRGVDLVFFPYTKEQSSTKIQDIVLPPRVDAARPQRVLDPGKGDGVHEEGFRYLFPFNRVNRGERIVLYGAGDVGAQYARQLEALEFCEIVAFADRNYESVTAFCGYPVWAPEALKERANAYDRIVVASTRYYGNILSYLRMEKIDSARVV